MNSASMAALMVVGIACLAAAAGPAAPATQPAQELTLHLDDVQPAPAPPGESIIGWGLPLARPGADVAFAAAGGPAADMPGSQHLALELADGSRLVGCTRIATIRLIAPYGRLDLAFDHVRVIEFNPDRERARLRMHNGDLLSGVPELPEIVLTTPAGRQVVQTARLARVVRIPAEAAELEARLVHGQTEGERTDFVKDLPADVAAKLKKVTRTLETFSGGNPERHRAGPWLYPIDGKGEIPRVLRETDAICYPIWGTWRQRWADGWIYMDENGAQIEGPKSRHPHYESAVDYYVVPLVPAAGAEKQRQLPMAAR